jgi:hypothetical protein
MLTQVEAQNASTISCCADVFARSDLNIVHSVAGSASPLPPAAVISFADRFRCGDGLKGLMAYR